MNQGFGCSSHRLGALEKGGLNNDIDPTQYDICPPVEVESRQSGSAAMSRWQSIGGRVSNPKFTVLQPESVFQGRYCVLRCLNAGSMGAVYEVIDKRTESRRALKVMLPELVEDADLRSRFEREAKITGAIQSDHIVRILDAGVDEPTRMPFLVMELLQGEELAALIKQRRALQPEEAFVLLRQAAVALDKTHAAGIVHRDLKPENMFVTFRDDGSPCLKILDFGIAKVVVSSNQARATRPMGTPLYMAPEQILGEGDIGPRTDLFALGHIAYTLLTGESYWAEETKPSVSLYPLLSKILNGVEEMPSARAARRSCVALPEGFDIWFLRATAVRPEDRFPRAVDMVAALSNAMRIPMPRPSSPSTELCSPGITIPGAPLDLPLGTAARTGEPVGTVPLSTELLDWSTSDVQGTGRRPSRTDMASVAASKNTPVASPAHRRVPKAVPLAACALALAGVATAGIIVVKPDNPNQSGGVGESTNHVTTKALAQTVETPPLGGGAPTASTEPLVTAVPAVEMASPTSTFQSAVKGAAMVTAQPTVATKPSKKPAQAPAGGHEAHKPAPTSPLPQDAPSTSPPPKKERPGIY